ncbi:U4/U5/U6 small nuclear ribonucleoprotein prp3 [Lecanora helva]
MADSPSNGLKRRYPDDLQNGGNTQKKARSSTGSPAPPANGVVAGKPDVSKIMADARARAAAIASKMQQGTGSKINGSVSPAPPPQSSGESVGMSRAEQLKARVAAAMAKSTNAMADQRTPANFQAPPLEDGPLRARGGLGIGLHPSLMEGSQGSAKNKQAIQPKFATTMANRRPESPANLTSKAGKDKKQLDLSGPSAEEYRQNPYFDPSLGAQTATLRSRGKKELIFNQKGKYVQQAAALRRQKNLEELKQRVAANSKRAGLQEDPTEKNFKKEEPPSVEWWDEGLCADNYNNLEQAKIDTEDSIVTIFVQHPVLIEPPYLKNMPAPKPLPLTKREQAKLRRMTRMNNLKEQQAKERLGLVPTPPPKVKIGNMMVSQIPTLFVRYYQTAKALLTPQKRVLGEEAVKDPTAVEARVNREIADRKTGHEQMNEDRKLTKEAKNEKLEEKKAGDAAKGIHVAVFKVNSLANGRHRFKVSKNAEQMSLSGTVVCGMKQTLIIAEGGQKSVRDYTKLMMNRINWAENDMPPVREGNKLAKETWLQAQEEDGSLKDLSENRCVLIFEGETAGRVFRKWAFKAVETDKEAMDALSRAKMENFWTQAKGVR